MLLCRSFRHAGGAASYLRGPRHEGVSFAIAWDLLGVLRVYGEHRALHDPMLVCCPGWGPFLGIMWGHVCAACWWFQDKRQSSSCFRVKTNVLLYVCVDCEERLAFGLFSFENSPCVHAHLQGLLTTLLTTRMGLWFLVGALPRQRRKMSKNLDLDHDQ